jgi:Ca2+-binding RTX toxin-like protein
MFESLECRQLFTGYEFEINPMYLPNGISTSGSAVYVKGMYGNDGVTVSLVNGNVRVALQGWAWTPTEQGPAPLVYINQSRDFAPGSVSSIRFWGFEGKDSITNSTTIPCKAWGGTGSDTLTGGSGADSLMGGAENDKLFGGGGADDLHGNDGNDTVSGQAGNDSIWGDAGDDRLIGGTGSDYLHAKDGVAGNDRVFGDNEDGTGGTGYVDTAVIDRKTFIAPGGGYFFVDDQRSGLEGESY